MKNLFLLGTEKITHQLKKALTLDVNIIPICYSYGLPDQFSTLEEVLE